MYATASDAHREWHTNSGVPMGLPGCPQDACHTDYMDPAEVRALSRIREINFAHMRGEEGEGRIRHLGHLHLNVAAARACAAEAVAA